MPRASSSHYLIRQLEVHLELNFPNSALESEEKKKTHTHPVLFPFGPKYAAMVESSDEALVLKLIFWRPMAEYLWDRKEIIKAVRGLAKEACCEDYD
jgi:hypothetical protein